MAEEASPSEAPESSDGLETAPDPPASRKRRQSPVDDEDAPKRQRIDDDQAPQSAGYGIATSVSGALSDRFGRLEPSFAKSNDESQTPQPDQYVAVTQTGWTPSDVALRITPSANHHQDDDCHRSTTSEEFVSPSASPSPSNLTDSAVPASTNLITERYVSLAPLTPCFFDFVHRESQVLHTEQYDAFSLRSLYEDHTDNSSRIESAVAIPEEPTTSEAKDPVSRIKDQGLGCQHACPQSYAAKVKQAARAFDKMIDEPSRAKTGATDHDQDSNTAPAHTQTSASNKQPLSMRQRGTADRKAVAKRLFGGMMQAAAGGPVSVVHQRRAEIEQRQREKLRRQDEEATREYERSQKRLQQRNARKQWEYRRSAVSLSTLVLVSQNLLTRKLDATPSCGYDRHSRVSAYRYGAQDCKSHLFPLQATYADSLLVLQALRAHYGRRESYFAASSSCLRHP